MSLSAVLPDNDDDEVIHDNLVIVMENHVDIVAQLFL